MKKLYIIGAGGFGREVLNWALHCKEQQSPEWEIAGFLDGNVKALNGFGVNASVVGDPNSFVPSEGDLLLCAVGHPATRLRLCTMLEERGGSFATLIHPTVVMGLHCHIGEGSILCPNTVVTTNVTVGKHVIVNVGATLGHDVVVGDGSTLNSHCDVTGGASLGKGVFLGSHAVILPRAKVGDFARVGAGSTVLRRAVANTTVFGVPAKRIPRIE